MPRARVILTALVLFSCNGTTGGSESPISNVTPECSEALELSFAPDTADLSEAYVCYGFDSSAFAAATIGGMRWSIPESGGYLFHHAILYAVPGAYPDGPAICDGMPEGAVQLHVWSPGGDDLALPPDTGLLLPPGTERFVVEAHTLKLSDEPTDPGGVRICNGPDNPARAAALMGTGAPVPAIRPLHEETSAGTCALAGDVHLFSVWPHMHRVGREITVELMSSSGTTELANVAAWDFRHQRTYPLDIDASAGDQIRVSCTWENPSDEYVLPGPKTENEMCNAAFIAWPAISASCD
jgi:hypothetical protein